jgi:hypothetical protein
MVAHLGDRIRRLRAHPDRRAEARHRATGVSAGWCLDGADPGFAQKSCEDERLGKPFALAIVVAWKMMFARILAAVAVINRDLLGALWFPLAAAGATGAVYGAWLHFSDRASPDTEIVFANPFEVGPALRFGLLYAAVLLVSRAAQLEFGDRGVLVSALVAGVADVDAITLSLSELSRSGQGLSLQAAAGVMVAAMANTALKGESFSRPGLRRCAAGSGARCRGLARPGSFSLTASRPRIGCVVPPSPPRDLDIGARADLQIKTLWQVRAEFCSTLLTILWGSAN